MTLHGFELGHGFLDTTPKAQATKGKVGELDIIKFKSFGISKCVNKKVKKRITK